MEKYGTSENEDTLNRYLNGQEEKKEIEESEKKYFAQFPKWYFKSGMIKYLTGTEVKVLCILLDKAGWANSEGKIVNNQLVSASGISKGNNIKNIINKLEVAGIITTWKEAKTRYYKIVRGEPLDLKARIDTLKKQKEKTIQDDYGDI